MAGITRYAKALLSLAREQNAEETIGRELAQVAEVLAEPPLAKLLALPNLSLKIRKEVVDQLVQALSPHPLLSNFLRVLAENDRLRDFPTIERAYQRLLEQLLKRVRARIRSASPLNDQELTALVDAFSRLTQKTVVPLVEVDSELLGGAVVEIEGQVYDASLKTQLQRLGEALAQHI
jgi:F-type H+-transporting ATPase subunit delta